MVVVLVGALAVLGITQLVALRDPRHRQWRPRVDDRQWLVTAVVVGAALRLLWVVIATRTPTGPLDPAEYLRIASELGHGHLPTFGGVEHSAYWPPGYPAVLAPAVALADRTGWLSPAFAASLVNVAAGTLTILLSGAIAARWLGERARVPSAWLVALCPALVFFTATAHSETVFTALLLGLIWLTGRAAAEPSTRRWIALGLLIGAAFLVRSPAVIAVVLPALAIRATAGSWVGSLRATGLVLGAAVLVLVPWMVRNGVQVGFWSPASTNNAAAACFGHHDDAVASWEESLADDDLVRDCFGESPYDDRRLLELYGDDEVSFVTGEPDEPRWYRERMADAVRWAVGHPVDEARLAGARVWETWKDEGRVVDAARNYADPEWAGGWHRPLDLLADAWLWIVGTLAVLGVVLVPACRRAAPVWAPIVLLTVAIAEAIAEPHYRYPVVPLVAVLAAGFLTRDPEPADLTP